MVITLLKVIFHSFLQTLSNISKMDILKMSNIKKIAKSFFPKFFHFLNKKIIVILMVTKSKIAFFRDFFIIL